MPVKVSIFGYILFFVSLIVFYFSFTKKPKEIVKIQKEIHYIQSVRKEQTKKTDSTIHVIKKKTNDRITILKQLPKEKIDSVFDSEIVAENDSNKLEQQKITCLEYKYKFERDSASFKLMKNDRDSCNEQLDRIVDKADTIVIESKKEASVSLKKGFVYGFISGVVAIGIAAITLVLSN